MLIVRQIAHAFNKNVKIHVTEAVVSMLNVTFEIINQFASVMMVMKAIHMLDVVNEVSAALAF